MAPTTWSQGSLTQTTYSNPSIVTTTWSNPSLTNQTTYEDPLALWDLIDESSNYLVDESGNNLEATNLL